MKATSPIQPGSAAAASRARLWAFAAAALVLAACLILFYVPPREVADLDPVPDAMELAIGGRRFAAGESYHILVDGRPMPPRYPPWFSLVFEAPVFLIGSHIGLAILPVTAAALAGIAIAFYLGMRAAGMWGGSASALALAALPLYRRSSGQVMSDVPCAALVLACMALYVRLRHDARGERARFFAAGALGTLAFLIRPVSGAVLIPLGLLALARSGWGRRASCAAALTIPFVAGVLAQLAYHRHAFGDPFRTGFQYWCAVPYDYPEMVMSWAHAGENLRVVVASKLAWLAAGAGVLGILTAARTRSSLAPAGSPRGLRAMAEFTVACGLPILLFHLQYYWARPRYYLPVFAMLLVLAGSLVGSWIERAPRWILAPVLASFLAAALHWRSQRVPLEPVRYLAAQRILARTPEDAIVITAIPAPYLEELSEPGPTRTFVALSRGVEYASKIVVRRRIDDLEPPPSDPWMNAHPGLLAGGGEWAVPEVALDRIDELRAALAQGRRIFVDGTDADSTGSRPALDLLRTTFRSVVVEADLHELVLR